ncbi:NAD(P)-binding protein [Dietzia aerolata]|uniref:NAD(P)-binding protein n=1 Tax=Dietzia aerolata TaxID=595984 RepID=UPI003630E990
MEHSRDDHDSSGPSHTHDDHGTQHEQWDAIVIGGGAAGLSAAQMLGRSRRRVLVADTGTPRNRFAAHMHGVLGDDGTRPADLLQRGRDELAAYDVTIRQTAVTAVEETATADNSLLIRFADAPRPTHGR